MCNKFEVLLIEDNNENAKVIINLLKKYDRNFKVIHKLTLKGGLKSLDDKNFDLILLDLVLPNGEGIKVFEKVHNKSKDIPIIIISGYEDKAIEAVQKGAQDYIVKPIHSVKTLGRSVRYAIERKKTEIKIRKDREKLLTIFNNLDVLIYIADPITHEILYTNDALKKHFNNNEWLNCYKLFLNKETPCKFCRDLRDNLGLSYEWEFENPINTKWYKSNVKFIEWPGNKIVEYGMAVDITKEKELEKEVKNREQEIIESVKNEIDNWNDDLKTRETFQKNQLNHLDDIINNLTNG